MFLDEKDIVKDWIVDDEIYTGKLSCVHLAHNIITNERVVIKSVMKTFIDGTDSSQKILAEREINVYNKIKNLEGFPKLIHFDVWEYEEEFFNYFILSYVGTSLGQFKKNTVLTLELIRDFSIQILDRLETIHNLGILHNDIKPNNITIMDGKIYLIDFGLSSFFEIDGEHIPYSSQIKFSGTLTYSSINSLAGIQRSRKDDIESFCYLITDLIEDLPWKYMSSNLSRIQKKEYVHSLKIVFCPNNLAMVKLIKNVRKLKFIEK